MGRARTLLRWGMPLVGGLAAAFLMAALFYLDLKTPRGGLADLVTMGLKSKGGVRFGTSLVLRELLPLHALMGLLAWMALFLPGALLLPASWRIGWRGWMGFLGALSGVTWMHLWYWWKVPTTLWVIPGIRSLPVFAGLVVIAVLALAPTIFLLTRTQGSWVRRSSVLILGLFMWTGLAQAPLTLAKKEYHPPTTATHETKILMLAIDGLRQDVAYREGLGSFSGTHFPNAYSPLPATRLLYHLVWGGDPDYYTVGHVVPSWEEYQGRIAQGVLIQDELGQVLGHFGDKTATDPIALKLLEATRAKGWKVRFCIDDGGTIGLSGRSRDFDAIHMPASGWENFVNSNLGVRFPLYAAWMDVLRVFPSTTPWSDPVAPLVRTLEVGRGADWVMLHSCAAHQPIFLTRHELTEIPGWWKLQPRDFEPRGSWKAIDQRDVDKWQPERNPALAYRIRIHSILRAYQDIWNGLGNDPDYKQATRIFFSDHGERFYHVTEEIQLQGVHGFGLDPWEMRIPLVIQSPGAPAEPRQAKDQAISLLNIRDAIWDKIQGKPITPEELLFPPFAPGRYHTITSDSMRPTDKKFRQQSKEKIINATYILPNGLWVMKYDRPASERSKDVTLARAVKDCLTVFKPLEGGGAQQVEYEGYRLISEKDISEEEFQKAKQEIETIFFKHPWPD